MAEVGTLIDGKYEVLRLVGEGGMSRVWLVSDKRLNKLWAAKEIKRTARDVNDETVVQSLIAEANLMKRLDHPALPRIVDIIEDGSNEDDSTLYVVMDYVEGESLNKVLARVGHGLPQDDVIDWGIQLCDALGYLHSRKPPIIYRDMKPGNIMLRDDGTVKLIDFGIAREYKQDKTSDTKILGTRGYAAPEQSNHLAQTDARTDIYSLGVTLYHLVTGIGPSEQAVMRPIREVDPRLSEGLEHIIATATQPDPEKRYQSCEAFSYDLEHHEKLTEGYRRALKRKLNAFRALAVAGVLCVVLGIGGIVGASVLATNTYNALIATAESQVKLVEGGDTGAQEQAEEAYESAISQNKGKLDAYEGLLALYRADKSITDEELNALYDKLVTNGSALTGDASYGELCYDVGVALVSYYGESGDGSQTYALAAAQKAVTWFELALEHGLEQQADEEAAQTYALIGSFYTDFEDIQNGTDTEANGGGYDGLWASLASGLESISGDDEVVRARYYQLVFEVISSQSYLNWFEGQGGVEAAEVESALETVVAYAQEHIDAQEGTYVTSICTEIVEGEQTARIVIELVYGDAASSTGGGQS